MSKKTSGKIDLLKLFRKGKELYDEYDTVVSVARSSGVAEKLSAVKQSDIPADDDVPLTEKEDVVETEKTAEIHSPVDIKQYRAEIEADDSFHESLSTLEDAAGAVYKSGFRNPADVEQAIRILGEVAQDTIRYAEEQETRREEIRAIRDTQIAEINAMRDCVQRYLERTFDERSAIFAKQFEIVDVAIRAGDNEMLVNTLNSINSLAASSPFKNLADLNDVRKSLTSSNTEWDI